MAKIDTLFMTKTAENHTLWGRTYLYSPYKGIPPPRVPVKDRSRSQKAACVRFWRAKAQFTICEVNGRKRIFFKGKEVTKKPELSTLVEKEFRHCKGAGSRRLKQRLIRRFQGVSE